MREDSEAFMVLSGYLAKFLVVSRRELRRHISCRSRVKSRGENTGRMFLPPALAERARAVCSRIGAVGRERSSVVRRNRRSHGWGSGGANIGLVVRDNSSGGCRHEVQQHDRLHEHCGFVRDGCGWTKACTHKDGQSWHFRQPVFLRPEAMPLMLSRTPVSSSADDPSPARRRRSRTS